jgi:hypothetical protein
MESFQPECALPQQIPVESFDVPDIENNAMPFGNGPLIKGIVPQDLKELVGRISRMGQPHLVFVAGTDCSGECSHGKSLPLMRFVREGCTEIAARERLAKLGC